MSANNAYISTDPASTFLSNILASKWIWKPGVVIVLVTEERN